MFLSLGVCITNPVSAATLLAVDFGDTGAIQSGFTANATGNGVVSGESGIIASWASSSTTRIVNRSSINTPSNGSEATIPNGTNIDAINQDFLFSSDFGGHMTISLSGLTNGVEYTLESWHADGTVETTLNIDQLIEFSSNGGITFIPIATVGASTNFSASRVTDTRTYNTDEDWVFRITESNALDQLRINAFSLTTVPEPSSALLLTLGLFGLSTHRKRI